MRKLILSIVAMAMTVVMQAQTETKKVYNEDIDPIEQIDNAVATAKQEGKHVICQVGGNWCPWCLRLADFIVNDSTVNKTISDNYVYIHVNYNPRKAAGEAKQAQAAAMLKRLDNPARFGFPALVVLDGDGNVIHTQDSSFLEEGKGYSQKKVLRFLNNWTPKAVKQ